MNPPPNPWLVFRKPKLQLSLGKFKLHGVSATCIETIHDGPRNANGNHASKASRRYEP
jgi:hypothetical protein